LGKRLLWLIGKFSHTQQAIIQESLNHAQRMNCPSKMSAMMNERICPAARNVQLYYQMPQQQNGSSITYGFLRGPSRKADGRLRPVVTVGEFSSSDIDKFHASDSPLLYKQSRRLPGRERHEESCKSNLKVGKTGKSFSHSGPI
jgi:hypothetical protein